MLILSPVVSAVYLLVSTPPTEVRPLNAPTVKNVDPFSEMDAESSRNEVSTGGTTKQIISTSSPIQGGTSGMNVILLSRDTDLKYNNYDITDIYSYEPWPKLCPTPRNITNSCNRLVASL